MANIIDSLQEKAAPYIKMLRIKQQTILTIIFLLGALDAGLFRISAVIEIFLSLLILGLASFFLNDYFDSKDTDQFSYRERVKQAAVSPKIVLIIWLIFTIIGSAIMLYHGLIWQLIILEFIGIFYNAPPFRFKAYFPWDIVSLFVQTFVIYEISFSMVGLPWTAAINSAFITLSIFLAIGEFILLIMDREADQKANLKNSAVVIGYKWLIRLGKVTCIGAVVGFCYLIYTRSFWWYYPLILAIPYFGYAVGRLREAVYLPEKQSHSTLNISFTRAVTAMGLIALYLTFVFIFRIFLNTYDF